MLFRKETKKETMGTAMRSLSTSVSKDVDDIRKLQEDIRKNMVEMKKLAQSRR